MNLWKDIALVIILKPLKHLEMEVTMEVVAMIFYIKMLYLEKKNSLTMNSIWKCQKKTCCYSNRRKLVISSNNFIKLDHIKLLPRNYSSKMQGEDKA